MEPAEYVNLVQYEGWYWWYRAQRRALLSAMRQLGLRRGAAILDAGCGSGRNLIEMDRTMPVAAFGVDASPHAADVWNGDNGVRRQVGSVNELPYNAGSFDAVVSVDVICCEEVDPPAALREMARVLRDDGHLLLMVPAFQWLLSAHDRAVHCVRRFVRRDLNRALTDAGFRVERSRFLFGPFFPAIALSRLLRKHGGNATRSDLSPLPRWLNSALYAVAAAEQTVGRLLPAPVGTTILTVARKAA